MEILIFKKVTDKYPNLNDTKIFVKIIEELDGNNWFEIFEKVLKNITGVYNVIVSIHDKIYCFKDRFNIRPLCIGKNSRGFCVASESVALGDYNYQFEIDGGELIEISYSGLKRKKVINNLNKICIFEYIYFLNPDSMINNSKVYNIRYNLGYQLGVSENLKEKKDVIVIGSPDTGIPSGRGFADKLGVKYEQFLEKNKNKGRSFIISNDKGRKDECKKISN